MIVQYDFQVCLKIFEFNQRGERICFTKLVNEMKGTPFPISKSLDKLCDRGLVRCQWEKKDGCWMRCLHITDDFRGFIEGLANVRKVKE